MSTRIPVPARPRRRWILPALAAVGILLPVTGAEAQSGDRDAECIQRYNAAVRDNASFRPLSTANPANGCRRVAVAVTSDWGTRELFGTAVDPRDVAATRDQTTASPGEIAAPIEPVEAAGGSVAAVGTDRGAGAVAAIALNPSIFFVDPSDTEAVARWSRLSDVTLLVPVSDMDDGEGGDAGGDGQAVDYVGVRWGLNVTGLRRGSILHRAVVAAYNRFLGAGTPQILRIQGLLSTLPPESLEPCIRLLAETQSLDEDAVGRITRTCGGAPVAEDPTVVAGLREAIQAARIQADSRYLGLDLRADFGDLSLAGVDTVTGTALFAGIGWGQRFMRQADATNGVRTHVGIRYWDVDGREDNHVAVEGGLGFESIRYYSYQRLALAAGVDFQHRTGDAASDEETTSIGLTGTLNVPVTPTSSVTLNFVAPVRGERRGPVLSIKANWRLLWSQAF